MARPITIADVRDEMMDRSAEDHLVLADLAFTDEDIVWAMGACARKFNSLQPYSRWVEAERLPKDTNVFFDGIAWALYRRWHGNVAVNDYDYDAGGVSARVQGSLLKNLEALRDRALKDFVEAATAFKVSANISDAYGQIG